MKTFYGVLAVIAVVGVAMVGWAIGSKATPAVSQPIDLPELDNPTRLMDVARGVVKGNTDALFTIIEFADFQCPSCGAFAREDGPLIESEFIATGKAKFVYYDFPLVSLHANAFLAARAGHCAEDQGKFWEYHHLLYRDQSRWSEEGNPAHFFESYAGEVGIDAVAFSACLRSDRHADLVTANMKLGEQLQVNATPTVLVTQGRGIGRQVTATVQGIREAIELMQPGG